ncbi:MAG: hypothetical protein N4A72_17885 [Bacteroidales bacterium]|jgi:hypothetical protein|nr:hypothetical protein [Bacteroidales bacterium]
MRQFNTTIFLQKIQKVTIVLIFIIAASACKKDSVHPIPTIPVNFSVNINLPEFNTLTAIGNSKIIYKGFYGYNKHGIILYRASLTDFYAYDATSPEDLSKSVELSKSVPTATCPKTKKVYLLTNEGFSNEGGHPLKRYNASLNGTTLFVYN